MSVTDLSDPSPSRTSSIIAAGLTSAVCLLFLREIPELLVPALVGIAGVICLILSLETLDSRSTTASKLLTSLLTVPVAVGFVVGTGGTTLLLVGTYFPVSSGAEISVATLTIIGYLGVVIGTTLALLGIALGTFTPLATDPLREYTKLAFTSAIVPLLIGFTLVTNVTLFNRGSGAEETIFGDVLQRIWIPIVSPAEPELHLASFLMTVGAAAVALWLLVDRAPITELQTTYDGTLSPEQLTTLLALPKWLTIGAVSLVPPTVVLEIRVSPAELEATIGPSLYSFIQTLTTAGWLRIALLFLTVITLAWVLVSYAARDSDAESMLYTSDWTVPLLGGVLVTIAAAVIADSIYERAVDETATRLPEIVAGDFLEVANAISDIYGETTIVILLTGILVGLTAWLGLVLWAGVYTNYLADEGAGYSLACAGLLLATVSLSINGGPLWLVFTGVAVSIAVLDIGHFGTRLGREIGPGRTHSLDMSHAGVTLAIGVLAIIVAMAMHSLFSEQLFEATPTTTLALVFLVTGLVSFAAAIR